ncbi:disulfide bond formation protein DsbA [Nocardia speluncae]|uniref:Disulfide bond formation protein DsbA n=1 Tax=Nocardia speluncae TaxID=419477 RepID=A0A846X9J7_9NOCA|nr:disulfide bond formation protein DsbA [Nocardia speluncae]NKY32921.1 disulfide bond formation protein DsbA [Nocardia speluncae]
MAEIDLYVDPVCPFAWVTARWLLDAAHGEHTVAVKQMSLAVLNDAQTIDAGQEPMIICSRRFGRMFAAAEQRHGPAGFVPLYLALGPRLHPRGPDPDDDAAAAAALAEAGLDSGFLAALDDASFDSLVAEAHRASQQALGARGGSPIISIDGQGFGGPVLTAPPPPHRATALLRAVIDAASTPEFAALQRPYHGPPAFTTSERDSR